MQQCNVALLALETEENIFLPACLLTFFWVSPNQTVYCQSLNIWTGTTLAWKSSAYVTVMHHEVEASKPSSWVLDVMAVWGSVNVEKSVCLQDNGVTGCRVE